MMEVFNNYLGVEIDEIGNVLDLKKQEDNFYKLDDVFEDTYDKKTWFDGMEDFQVYKTMCFMVDYQNKQLEGLVKLRDLFRMKCKLSMLCKETKHWGIPLKTIAIKTLPKLVDDDYDHEWFENDSITPFCKFKSLNFDWNSYTNDPNFHQGDMSYIKIDVAIHIQMAMVDNTETGMKLIYEEKFCMDLYVMNILDDSISDADYKFVVSRILE